MLIPTQVILAIATWCNGSYSTTEYGAAAARECKSAIFKCIENESIINAEQALSICLSKIIKDTETKGKK